MVKLAFEFLVLTAARSGEVRGAEWLPTEDEKVNALTAAGRTVIECAVKGAIPQRVRIPPGNCRSSR